MCKTLCIFTGLGLASAGRARDPERKLGAHIPGVSLMSPRVSGKREPGSGPELEAPASKRDGEEHVRDNCELVDGRPTSPAGACAEDLATVLVERVHNVSIYWQTNSSMAASVPRAQCQCWSRERAEANGSQAARCRSHRKQAAHYLAAALTISTAAPQALGQSTNVRYGEGQVYIGRPRLYTARRWAAIQTLVAVASRQTARRTID